MHALVGGMRWGFGVGAILGVAVLVLALLMPDRVEAEPEGARRAPH